MFAPSPKEGNSRSAQWPGYEQCSSDPNVQQQWAAWASQYAAASQGKVMENAAVAGQETMINDSDFEAYLKEWEKDFDAWKEANKDHPDKESFSRYEKQWQEWRAQLLEKREMLQKKEKTSQDSSEGATTSNGAEVPSVMEAALAASNPNAYYQAAQYMYAQPYNYSENPNSHYAPVDASYDHKGTYPDNAKVHEMGEYGRDWNYGQEAGRIHPYGQRMRERGLRWPEEVDSREELYYMHYQEGYGDRPYDYPHGEFIPGERLYHDVGKIKHPYPFDERHPYYDEALPYCEFDDYYHPMYNDRYPHPRARIPDDERYLMPRGRVQEDENYLPSARIIEGERYRPRPFSKRFRSAGVLVSDEIYLQPSSSSRPPEDERYLPPRPKAPEGEKYPPQPRVPNEERCPPPPPPRAKEDRFEHAYEGYPPVDDPYFAQFSDLPPGHERFPGPRRKHPAPIYDERFGYAPHSKKMRPGDVYDPRNKPPHSDKYPGYGMGPYDSEFGPMECGNLHGQHFHGPPNLVAPPGVEHVHGPQKPTESSEPQHVHNPEKPVEPSEDQHVHSSQKPAEPSEDQHVHSSGKPGEPSEDQHVHSSGKPGEPSEDQHVHSSGKPGEPSEDQHVHSSGKPGEPSEDQHVNSSQKPAEPSEHQHVHDPQKPDKSRDDHIFNPQNPVNPPGDGSQNSLDLPLNNNDGIQRPVESPISKASPIIQQDEMSHSQNQDASIPPDDLLLPMDSKRSLPHKEMPTEKEVLLQPDTKIPLPPDNEISNPSGDETLHAEADKKSEIEIPLPSDSENSHLSGNEIPFLPDGEIPLPTDSEQSLSSDSEESLSSDSESSLSPNSKRSDSPDRERSLSPHKETSVSKHNKSLSQHRERSLSPHSETSVSSHSEQSLSSHSERSVSSCSNESTSTSTPSERSVSPHSGRSISPHHEKLHLTFNSVLLPNIETSHHTPGEQTHESCISWLAKSENQPSLQCCQSLPTSDRACCSDSCGFISYSPKIESPQSPDMGSSSSSDSEASLPPNFYNLVLPNNYNQYGHGNPISQSPFSSDLESPLSPDREAPLSQDAHVEYTNENSILHPVKIKTPLSQSFSPGSHTQCACGSSMLYSVRIETPLSLDLASPISQNGETSLFSDAHYNYENSILQSVRIETPISSDLESSLSPDREIPHSLDVHVHDHKTIILDSMEIGLQQTG